MVRASFTLRSAVKRPRTHAQLRLEFTAENAETLSAPS